jgi:hypothetical protein
VGAAIMGLDLAFVGNLRDHPGDKLQIAHPLERGVVAAPVADLALGFQKGQPLQGQDGAVMEYNRRTDTPDERRRP